MISSRGMRTSHARETIGHLSAGSLSALTMPSDAFINFLTTAGSWMKPVGIGGTQSGGVS